jgi:ADP-ribose pyrophosphatase YjhB (NUDIX family)
MKCLGIIREHDVFPDRQKFSDSDYTKTRTATRFVIFDNRNFIALNHRPKQNGYKEQYAIPGGGVEPDETIEDALKREALEETGCSITDIAELGYIIEYGVSPDLIQHTHVFTAQALKKLKPKYTESEITSNLSTVWLQCSDANQAVRNSSNSFSKTRSLLILNNIPSPK